MVSQLPGFVNQVVGVNRYAVSADQARGVGLEIPLGGCGIQNVPGTEPHFLKDEGKLVREGDIQVPLDILDDLGCFRSLYIPGSVNMGVYLAVELAHDFRSPLIHAGNHFGYLR